MPFSALVPNAVAVVTGGASGIGLAAAKRFSGMGLKVCLADVSAERLAWARESILRETPADADSVLAVEADVSRLDQLQMLEEQVRVRFGGTDVLMNNAGISPASTTLGSLEHWQRIMAVNLWGVIQGTQVFVPGMLQRNRAGLVINTGSKQGITTPPGNPAYNTSKAGVKTFTEALQHELRNTPGAQVTAHLLIPGFVFTNLTAGDRTEKPAAAWTPEQTVEFMLQRLAAGDFYLLCPDNDVSRSLDEQRILWAAGDIVENRPPLSRWHPDHAEAFKLFASASS